MDEGAIFSLEKWQSAEALYRHILSSLYSRVLEAMELSREPPEVSFLKIANIKGMELIEGLRKVEG